MARLYQVSTASSFKKGIYVYSITLEHFLRRGDLGFGTYNGFNGEAVIIDGKAYNCTANGQVKEMTIAQTGISYGYNVNFKPNLDNLTVTEVSSLEQLEEKLKEVMKYGEKYPYFVRIDGKFSSLKLRSVFKQVKPFKPMDEVIKDAARFEYKDEEGTLVGLFTPSEMKDLSFEGWQFNYISNDRTRGGKVEEVSLKEATVQTMFITTYELKIPNNLLFREEEEK